MAYATAQGRTFVAYLRVSTDKQGRSGLGLEAQQAAIDAFLSPADRLLAPPYVEVESGKNDTRPKLLEALARCKRTGATLLIAKMDRLSRDVHFITGLQKAGVAFVACDNPAATELTVQILAAVAQNEARMISQRTKAALAAAKARGVKLGGDRGYRPTTAPDSALATAARKQAADYAAHGIAGAIEAVRASLGGVASLNAIAAGLQTQGVQKPRGGSEWTATDVRRALARIEGATA